MKWPWILAISCSLFTSSLYCHTGFDQKVFADIKKQLPHQISPKASPSNKDNSNVARPVRLHSDSLTCGSLRNQSLSYTITAASNQASGNTFPFLTLPTSASPKTVLTNIRGIYISRPTFTGPRLNSLVRFVKAHGMNAMVVDVKDDNGIVSLGPAVCRNVKLMHQQHIYLIARIVTFKDPYLAKSRPVLAIQSRHGGTWTQSGVPWVDPYRTEVWRYNVAIAKRAVAAGFDEIQWDYVRFPDVPAQKRRSAVFANSRGVSRSDDISAFLKYARRELGHTPMSADVFGLVTSARDDIGIGQQWEKIAPYVDAISPMMYPSHYSPGVYGLKYPEQSPHLTIEKGLHDALMRSIKLQAKGVHTAVIRPWLQDFDMRVPYSQREVKAQIRAAAEAGINSYLLWNQGNNYTK